MAGGTRFSVDPTEFAGKRVLITGGTKGMGEAMVRRFQSSDAAVATTARSSLPHGQAPDLFVQADIGTVSGVEQVVGRIQDEWGRLDVLVNNVGGTETKPGGFEALSDEDWQNIRASCKTIGARAGISCQDNNSR